MRIAPLLAVMALLASGCIQGADIPDVGLPATHGDAAGTASGHGSPDVQTSDVTITHDGARYRASQTVTDTNGFGGADQAAVTLSTFNGAVTATGTGDSSYKGTVKLYGTGTTEQLAREALASMQVQTPDKLSGVSLDFGILVKAITAIPHESGRGASIDLTTPQGPAYNLVASSSNGAVFVSSLRGDVMKADTSNGAITFQNIAARVLTGDTSNGAVRLKSFVATEVTADTSNGAVEVNGQADTFRADTSNGAIEGTLHPAASGSYSFSTSNGAVSVTLKGDDPNGFDASADTSNGRATINLQGAEAVGTQSSTHQHQRTTNFSSKSVQTVVTADTSNGSVTLSQ